MTKLKRLILGAALALIPAMSQATAKWPNTLSSDSTLFIAVNNCGTTLNSSITSAATTISVAATACFPSVGYVTIDDEAIKYTGKTATTFTGCTRGSDGTSAAAHPAGSVSYHSVIAIHHNQMKDELIAMSTYFFQGTDVHIDTTTTPDQLGLGTASPTAHLTVWGQGSSNVLSASTNTSGSPAALVVSNAGATTAASLAVTGSATVGGTLGVTGAATAATLDTGQGANELYDMNQNVQTGDSVTFAGVTNSALTSGRFVLAGASGVLTDDADFTQNGTTATLANLSVPGNIATAITASRAVVTNASGVLAASAATATEVGYLSGVTSAIQTQINAITASPAGAIVMYASSTSPSGWLQCDGSTVSRTTYATLFAVIGTSYGTGDGSTTFTLPDFRGIFPKGAGTTSRTLGKDSSGNFYAGTIGTYSTDKMQGHKHAASSDYYTSGAGGLQASGAFGLLQAAPNPTDDGTNGTPRTGHTTEPQSVGVYFIIKT